ncbi:Glycosyl transferase group 1 [Hyella patelloides LEGE 07179]|uniref:Glycosyl transferase group 1 n=1 Tax=Hyella patelloides LEGE 07179 TaxID=945734 RepID=A0A563VMX4_9CYAN|nr:glycosyltransferase [Hyella patelloides]VEP12683.1 Glycosyl transferase group 1 [Hyella patelloides LEGE 07179]
MVKKSPHIALFLSYLGGGGAERVMLNLAEGIAKQGIQVDLVLGRAWGPHLGKIPSQVKLVDLGARGILGKLWSLSRYLKKKKPLVILSGMHYANEIAIGAKFLSGGSTKIVVSEHNTISRAIQQTSQTRKLLIPILVKYLYPLADSIVAVSQEAAKDLAQFTGLPLEHICSIYNPVISSELQTKSQAAIEHPWFVADDCPIILGVGKLFPQKDFPTLIRAFDLVKKERSARLVILGWGSLRSQLEALVEELGLQEDVAFLGYVQNPYPYMARAATFVLSSAWEGLPTVLIEAMALGTPVISTDCPSGPAEILDSGKYGWLTPVGDSETLAKTILSVLDGQTKKIDPVWLKQFEVETTTKQYLQLFDVK